VKESIVAEPALVSIIITCYNHAHYLPESINSILNQHYQHVEIILVDDGSIDNTKEIATLYPCVKYVYQTNQGLSAARNTGIDHSRGEFLVFLDADDWLLPNSLATNVSYLQKHTKAAFVSGEHIKVNEFQQTIIEGKRKLIIEDHYQHLLHHNYIEMHAAVMYRRWVFDLFRFDTTLKACEDYDMYMNIMRSYPVVHHQEPVAAYRKHSENMSGNIPLMIETGLLVMQRQQPYLKNEKEKRYSKEGIHFWKQYYGQQLYHKLQKAPLFELSRQRRHDLNTLLKYRSPLFFKYLSYTPIMKLKQSFLSKAKPSIKHLASAVGIYKYALPPKGKIKRGDFNRTKPFSKSFGYDRGGPVDRYYIENFLQQHETRIKGRVLEIGDNDYTLQFGADKITKSDILHIDDSNPNATFVGDLSNAPHLPSDSFDCIILTQTLHLIYDFKAALQTCYRILKPGGSLLLTVPGITPIDQGEWKNIWLWSFTEASIKRLLTDTFPKENFKINTNGNVLVATSFLYGVGLPEMKKEEMDYVDPHYPVIITAIAQKPS
jgi:glycosyltransferase involved in cell wall biosynthesis